MFGMGWPEILVCALVGFFVFGPERLPGAARDAARMLKQLRGMAQGVTDEFKQHIPDAEEFGLSDIRDLRDLHPKRVMSRALFDDDVADGGRPVATVAPAATPGSVPRYDIDAT
ncbi:MAG TPA: Sec-independent protein translocase protein TatB [Mycobacteriales bacterium]|jgi:sec-independent protein translocase protein TatB|nr:Sec-independent protein translocase protein TatB [Mycobacteriales bacterium]